MKETLVPGVSAERRHRVVTADLVSSYLSGMPPVLCTPCLLNVMEMAAYDSIRPHLDPGEASVGVGFEFQHLAPTPCGDTVVVTARVTAVEGRQVTIEFEARDSCETIARGKHVRAIVSQERFRRHLRRKSS